MKIVLPLACLILGACSANREDKGALSSIANNNLIVAGAIVSKDDLLGEWGIYDTFDGSAQIFCNACPTITFNENGTAVITYPGGTFEVIKWKRQKLILIIENVTIADNNGEFRDGQYSLVFGKEGRLEIKQVGTSYLYGLRRHHKN